MLDLPRSGLVGDYHNYATELISKDFLFVYSRYSQNVNHSKIDQERTARKINFYTYFLTAGKIV